MLEKIDVGRLRNELLDGSLDRIKRYDFQIKSQANFVRRKSK